jgi:hypothetical protein
MMCGRLVPGASRASVQTENAVHRALPLALLIATLLALPGHAPAGPRDGWHQVQGRPAETPPAGIDRREAAERAAASTGGKVLSAEPDTVDGEPAYRVKVLTPDGRVRNVIIRGEERGRAR